MVWNSKTPHLVAFSINNEGDEEIMKTKLMEMLESRKDEIIEIRRHLHENPELSFKEEKTAQYIIDFYKGKDVEVQTNVGNGYGIIVTIKGGKPGKTIGITC